MAHKVTIKFMDNTEFVKEFESVAVASQFAFEVFKHGVTFENGGVYSKYPAHAIMCSTIREVTLEKELAPKRKRK